MPTDHHHLHGSSRAGLAGCLAQQPRSDGVPFLVICHHKVIDDTGQATRVVDRRRVHEGGDHEAIDDPRPLVNQSNDALAPDDTLEMWDLLLSGVGGLAPEHGLIAVILNSLLLRKIDQG